ncbi:hypothetical protein [Phenylobacterium sp. J367]|uniref:hypothetical protein n=1 Tax=Phenylobacterium sp. J367 TaxID=2898435 RepID=UPI002151C931|nr:hypothetical protein [Phenylobacterium sp. J367]MCR5881184.1 hypothetical protein [Phenylobacterium sp. J367]
MPQRPPHRCGAERGYPPRRHRRLDHGRRPQGRRQPNDDAEPHQGRGGEGLTKRLTVESTPSRWRPGAEIVAARKAEFERLDRSLRHNGNVIHLPDDTPFMLVPLGDERLDNSGTDLNLFERWIAVLDRSKRITGWSMGDVLDNWVKPLAHLYGNAETAAPEGWILLQHYLDQIGPDLDCSIGGNHDAWSGHSDVLAMLMEQHGVLHRNNSLRVRYRCPSGREITVHGRHSWPGRSQWSEVHALKKAARLGVRDTILLGGHTHVSGESVERDPVTGKYTFVYQLASFKIHDDYADTLGLLDRHTSPALALVIDPRRPDTDPELVKHFYEPEAGADYLAFLRRKKAA